MKLECAAATDIGRERDDNEDGIWLADTHGMCAVFDGIAGAKGSGKYAAELAIAEAQASVDAIDQSAQRSLDERARSTLSAANAAILRAHGTRPYGSGFACSAVLLAVHEDEVALAFAGVCLGLRVREGVCDELTTAHDLLWEYHREAKHFDFAANGIAHRQVIVNALGLRREARIETVLEIARRDDVFVLCTSSVIDCVSPVEIATIVRSHDSVRAMADAIIALEIARSGTSNATAVVARVLR